MVLVLQRFGAGDHARDRFSPSATPCRSTTTAYRFGADGVHWRAEAHMPRKTFGLAFIAITACSKGGAGDGPASILVEVSATDAEIGGTGTPTGVVSDAAGNPTSHPGVYTVAPAEGA